MIPERLLEAFERIADALERQAACQENAQRLIDATARLQEAVTDDMTSDAAFVSRMRDRMKGLKKEDA